MLLTPWQSCKPADFVSCFALCLVLSVLYPLKGNSTIPKCDLPMGSSVWNQK